MQSTNNGFCWLLREFRRVFETIKSLADSWCDNFLTGVPASKTKELKKWRKSYFVSFCFCTSQYRIFLSPRKLHEKCWHAMLTRSPRMGRIYPVTALSQLRSFQWGSQGPWFKSPVSPFIWPPCSKGLPSGIFPEYSSYNPLYHPVLPTVWNACFSFCR